MILPSSLYGFSRRGFLGSAFALGACQPAAQSQTPAAALPPLKSIAPFPVGTAVQAAHLNDPALARLIVAQASQLTPEWEMKMEYIVRDDGTFRFEAPDAIAAFARAHRLGLFGHTLVWYAQTAPAFERLDEGRVSFAQAYRNYIHAVVGRYRGQAVGWDVVNEAVAEDGEGWRDSLWSQRLGAFDHMVLAFRNAREADPNAQLFLNDYNLELLPKKRASRPNWASSATVREISPGVWSAATWVWVPTPSIGAPAASSRSTSRRKVARFFGRSSRL